MYIVCLLAIFANACLIATVIIAISKMCLWKLIQSINKMVKKMTDNK